MQALVPNEIKQLLAMLQEGLDVPPQRRAAWLAGRDDAQHLKTTVAELLEKQPGVETDDFLQALAKHTGGSAGTLPPAPPVEGATIGPYRLLALIGEGGMSSVWLAEREDGVLRRKVALKLPHWWALSKLTDRAIRERDILATLEHPNIARLYDAGVTADGRPYLALEYIEGKPIDEFCERHALDVPARVRLLTKVARAVAYAHSRLIVHRDLKPSNILVDEQGEVHLLDFGIAKLLEEGSDSNKALTQVGARVLTLEYAAPEQIAGETITTETDVYALGVIAYELLCGARPYTFKNAASADWQILTSTIRAPSTAAPSPRSRALRGDLDTIVLKALKRDPSERYASAAAFADDLDRYLRGDPVLAQPDSAAYRLRKLAAKHRVVVGAAAAVVIALATGLIVASWQLRVARAEKQRAEEVKNFVASIFRSADPFFTGGAEMRAIDLLALAKDRVDRELATQPRSAAELLLIVGESQGNLGQIEAARATLEGAIAAASRSPRDRELLTALARAELAALNLHTRDYERGKREYDELIPVLRAHGQPAARALVATLLGRAFIAGDERDTQRAIDGMREAVAVAKASLGEHDSETILAERQLAQELLIAGQIEESVAVAREAHVNALTHYGGGGRNALLVETEDVYGRALVESGDLLAGIRHLENAIAEGTTLFGPENPAVYTKLTWLARAQLRLGDLPGATASLHRALAQMPNELDRARTSTSLGALLLAARRPHEAVSVLEKASADLQRLESGEGTWLPRANATLGTAFALTGRGDDAERILRANIERSGIGAADLAESYNGLGWLALSRSDPETALAHFQRALDNAGPEDPPSRARAAVLLGLAEAQLRANRLDEAEQIALAAESAHAKLHERMVPARADALLVRARVAMRRNQPAHAAELLESVRAFWSEYDASSPSLAEIDRLLREARSVSVSRESRQ